MKTNRSTLLAILIFSVFFVSSALFYHPVKYDNTLSRYLLVNSIVNYGTFSIDSGHAQTIDKSDYKGHYYSNKAPGTPFLGAVVYKLKKIFDPNPLSRLKKSDLYIIRVFTTTLPFAFLGVVMFRLAIAMGCSERRSLLMVIAYGLGTIALLHATLFSGHQNAASFSFMGFAAMCRLPSRKPSWLRALAGGVLTGLAAISDFPAMLIAAAIAIYVITTRNRWQENIPFFAGAGFVAVCLGIYNWQCFENPFVLAYSKLSLDTFREQATRGVFGVRMPRPLTAVRLLFSPSRGLFFLSPVLLLAVPPLLKRLRKKNARPEALLLVCIPIIHILFNSGYVGWHGGWTHGPRYLVPALPFLAFPVVFGRWRSVSIASLLAVSVMQVWPAQIGMPHVPQEIVNPLTELLIPMIAFGYTAQNVFSLLGFGAMLSILFALAIICALVITALKLTEKMETQENKPSLQEQGISVFVPVIILIAILCFRTEPRHIVHVARYRLLADAARITNSESLSKHAFREKILSGIKGNRTMQQAGGKQGQQ